MAAAQNYVEFNYDLTKTFYMTQIKKCFDEDSMHSDAIIQKTIDILKTSPKSHLHKNYQISYSFGSEILMEKSKPPADPIQVLSFEDVFDLFIKYHTGNNHKGGHQHLTQMEKQFSCTYNYPAVCLSIIVKSCNFCKSRSLKPTVNKVSLVYVTVMVEKEMRPNFKYILIYIDKATDYVIIRPLMQKSDVEVSTEIFKILMQFGPPQKLCLHGYNTDFNKRVGSLLRQACPMFSFGIEYRPANFDPSAIVVKHLVDWMATNVSVAWEIGCSVVQQELNTTCKSKLRHDKENMYLSPNELFYGKMHDKIASGCEQNNRPYKSKRSTLEKRETSTNVTQLNKLETIVIDEDVVELRIPSPENFNIDLLSQFEDSEISQELNDPVIKNRSSVGSVKARELKKYKRKKVEDEPNIILDGHVIRIVKVDSSSVDEAQVDVEIQRIESILEREDLNDIDMSIVRNKDESEGILINMEVEIPKKIRGEVVKGNAITNTKERKRKQTFNPLNMTSVITSGASSTILSNKTVEILSVDMECEDENEKTKKRNSAEMTDVINRKMTLRSSKRVQNVEDSPEYTNESDEELVYYPDDTSNKTDEAKDPFEDVASPESVDYSTD